VPSLEHLEGDLDRIEVAPRSENVRIAVWWLVAVARQASDLAEAKLARVQAPGRPRRMSATLTARHLSKAARRGAASILNPSAESPEGRAESLPLILDLIKQNGMTRCFRCAYAAQVARHYLLARASSVCALEGYEKRFYLGIGRPFEPHAQLHQNS
jgi:hypothetical protein